jgi:hypothetical protein
MELKDYWQNRDSKFRGEWTEAVRKAADDLIERVNGLLTALDYTPEIHPVMKSPVTSGWRPPSFNPLVQGASPRSNHITGKAVDLYDPEGELDELLLTAKGKKALESAGLWQEHPSATKGWCHLQSVPPKSGNRVFYP